MKRLRPPGVTPIEVWDLPVGGRTLQHFRREPGFGAALAEAVRGVIASPPRQWLPEARERTREVKSVYLVGGGVTPGLTAQMPVPCTVSEDLVFGAARAGLALISSPYASCLDVGQTSLKWVDRHRAERIERDLLAAPVRDDCPLAERFAARASTIQFIGGVLGRSSAVGGPVLLALPCKIDDDCSTSGCTYCWSNPDPMLPGELAAAAGLDASFLQLINDGELAAICANRDPRLQRDGVVLVLTIGFAVGGALLEPRR